jgi:transcriptional regulator with GAF, ATPase, and Fis domain
MVLLSLSRGRELLCLVAANQPGCGAIYAFSNDTSEGRGDHRMTKPIVASTAMTELLKLAERAAVADSKVLITGESGVGKDIVARHIHAHSGRRHNEFVPVNCAGVTETLLESELFGHVKGSFTGAYRDKVGKLQLAHRGTLFLDEVGEMSLRMQALLLRFLENGEIHAVGSDAARTTVDVRVIAATIATFQKWWRRANSGRIFSIASGSSI